MREPLLDLPIVCPNCTNTLAASRPLLGGAPPRPGDICLCGVCATPLTVTPEYQLRPLTDADRRTLHPNTLARMRDAQRDIRSQQP